MINGLLGKYLNKISVSTILKFGSLAEITSFLELITKKGNFTSAGFEIKSIPFLELQKIIKSDKYLRKCIDIALNLSLELAEGTLYDRAINGYEELTYNKEGEVIRKTKYCSRSLLEYLKANSPKYSKGDGKIGSKVRSNTNSSSKANELPDSFKNEAKIFEIESYGANE